IAAMHSFAKGPTVPAIRNIAETISHLPAEVKESIFEGWSLGYSPLDKREFGVIGEFITSPTKHNDGILIDSNDQRLTLPVISNFKLDDGTFSTWIRPNWDGLDNFGDLVIKATKDGYDVSELDVFVGALEYHPVYEFDNSFGGAVFKLDKTKNVE